MSSNLEPADVGPVVPQMCLHACKTLKTVVLHLSLSHWLPCRSNAAAEARSEIIWTRAFATLATLPPPVTRLRLVLEAPLPSFDEVTDVPISKARWNEVIQALQLIDHLRYVDVMVTTCPIIRQEKRGTCTPAEIYHPAVFNFFYRCIKDLFPPERQYQAGVSFSPRVPEEGMGLPRRLLVYRG